MNPKFKDYLINRFAGGIHLIQLGFKEDGPITHFPHDNADIHYDGLRIGYIKKCGKVIIDNSQINELKETYRINNYEFESIIVQALKYLTQCYKLY